MTDNVGLSFVLVFIEKMARIVDQNPENRTRHGSPRSQETSSDVDRIAPSAEPDASTDDLPDIVDLVMEMSRGPDDTTATDKVEPLRPLPCRQPRAR
ncbi:hypothetical protein [Sphingomonas sp. Ant H11]|uniref:hypothetical protein n=1 Tax=Sphingomonas sp. Ant H11 TaxID=1564113 RepID=UPI0018CD3D5A|nr:hypothetical protein [Sphingomonas sp. Ant H11]